MRVEQFRRGPSSRSRLTSHRVRAYPRNDQAGFGIFSTHPPHTVYSMMAMDDEKADE